MDFSDVQYKDVHIQLKRLINKKLIDNGDDPNKYEFRQGFAFLPFGQALQCVSGASIATIALMDKKTSEYRFFCVLQLLKELELTRVNEWHIKDKHERCPVVNIHEFKRKDKVPD